MALLTDTIVQTTDTQAENAQIAEYDYTLIDDTTTAGTDVDYYWG